MSGRADIKVNRNSAVTVIGASGSWVDILVRALGIGVSGNGDVYVTSLARVLAVGLKCKIDVDSFIFREDVKLALSEGCLPARNG